MKTQKNEKVFVVLNSWPGGQALVGVFTSLEKAMNKVDAWCAADSDTWRFVKAHNMYINESSGGENDIIIQSLYLDRIIQY